MQWHDKDRFMEIQIYEKRKNLPCRRRSIRKTYLWNAGTKEIVRNLVLFNSNEFKNKNFEFKNISFGNFYEFYKCVEFKQIGIKNMNEELDLIKYPKIDKQISKNEFMYLWRNYDVYHRLINLKRLRLIWLIDSLQKKGVIDFIKKIKEII